MPPHEPRLRHALYAAVVSPKLDVTMVYALENFAPRTAGTPDTETLKLLHPHKIKAEEVPIVV